MLLAASKSQGLLKLPAGVHLSQRNTPALFGAKLIDELPERVIIAMERQQRLRWGLAAKDDKDLPVGRLRRLDMRLRRELLTLFVASAGEYLDRCGGLPRLQQLRQRELLLHLGK